ncbi:ABC transporter permease [Granulosicoccus antarcticus]|uniref:Dipeptide transport system permease protein DppC n=1 Tax=Granulosicoccus antarcticus IMCC3135 TaxID=1192854 RepID=A0A2Z2NZ17_9GAMM|nr:ABC transporter permease [Granulosicoccus antarcticus]ASJ76696.1 Dipeptide transport system permease protein DppC [Granulosicoccus antarcticus IMCC3135]
MIARLRRYAIENELLYLFLHSRLAQLAALMAILMIGGAILANFIAPTDPYDLTSYDLLDSLLPPSWSEGGDSRFIIGTDDQGRDLLSAILYGTRLSLIVGLLSISFACVLGVSVGLMAGYLGGRFDAIVMRIADVQLSLPAILTALLIDGIARGILPQQRHDDLMIVVLTLAIGLSLWVNFARTARASTFVEKNKEYVQATEIMGMHPLRIMLVQILPNIMGPIMVILTVDLAVAILLEATLSFLGVGVPANQPSLGTLIRIGTEYLFSGEWWIVAFPSLTLIVLIVSVNILGDFLRDALNPKLR